VAAGNIRVRRRIHIQSLSGLVGPVEPPIEAVITRADARDVSRAADRTLARQHVRLPTTGKGRVRGNGTVDRHPDKLGLDQLHVPPLPVAQVEQPEAREIAHGQSQAPAAIGTPKGIERTGIFKLERSREARFEHLGAVGPENLLRERVVIEREGKIVVRIGRAGRFGQTVAGSLRGQMPPGDGGVLAVVERLETRLELGHETVHAFQPAFLDRQKQQGGKNRLEG
jgi:hypothetical protein